jgi:ADP-heptose:LPS heptosyltransferase
MGDAVMVRSIIEHLCDYHPDVEIGVLVGSATREVMTLGRRFNVHVYRQGSMNPRSALGMIREIRRRRYDAILNFEQGSLAGTAVLMASGIPIRGGFVPIFGKAKAAFLTHPIRFRSEDSMWQSFLRLLRLVDPNCSEPRSTQPLPVSCEADGWIRNWMSENAKGDRPWVALHLGCGPAQSFRRWRIDRFVELGERLLAKDRRMIVVLTGQPFEKQLVDEFRSQYPGLAVDATHLATLERTAALLQLCDLVVSNDTGVMHLAAAMGAPTVGIMGPNVPKWYAPVGPRAAAVYTTTVECSPCIDIYRLQVPTSCSNCEHARCLSDVTVDSVFNTAGSLVERGWLN